MTDQRTGYHGNKNAEKSDKRDTQIQIRVYAHQKRNWMQKAKELGLTLSNYIASKLDAG